MGDRIGQQLGNYRVIGKLGEGGFAEVYLGEHIHLGTQAAIKVLRTQLISDDADKFRLEARTIAHLVHPNIVRVLEYGLEGTAPFLVMDYAPNGTLRQRHPKGTQLPLDIIIGYVKQIASALQYAHNEKLVHRDVKPENMLLGRHNEVLMSDFGIALVAQSSRYQSTQDVIGTVAYMSPEQIQGRPRPASDQYSLAIVVYEWLTGDRPFHGSFTELCTQHMFATPPPLRERAPTISPDIEQVVMTALAKDPHQRFMTVQAFATALEQAYQPTVVKPRYDFEPVRLSQSASIPETEFVPPPPPPPLQANPYAPPPAQPNPYAYPPINTNPSGPYAYTPASPITNPAPITTSPQWGPATQAQQAPRKVSGGIRLLALLIGTAIFIGLDYALGSIIIHSFPNSPLLNPIFPSASGVLLYITPYVLLTALFFTVPLFFAVEFGVWVGLVCVLAGAIAGDYIAFHGFFTPWYLYLSDAIFCLIPGIAFNITHGRYNKAPSFVLAMILSLIGIGISNIIVTIGDTIKYQYAATIAINEFLGLTLANLAVSLPVLLILLLIYNAIFNRRRAA